MGVFWVRCARCIISVTVAATERSPPCAPPRWRHSMRAAMERRPYQNAHLAQCLCSYERAAPRRGQVLQLPQDVELGRASLLSRTGGFLRPKEGLSSLGEGGFLRPKEGLTSLRGGDF